MKREVIADKGIGQQKTINSELLGYRRVRYQKPKLKMMGIEAVKVQRCLVVKD